MNYLLFYTLAFLAEIVGTVGGFGSSVYFVALASFFFDFKTVLGLTALMHLFSNASKLALFWRHLDFRLIARIGVPSTLLVLLGAWLSDRVVLTHLDLVMGLLLIAIAVVLWYFRDRPLRPTAFNTVALGGLSGFTAGLIGTGGAIRGLLLTAFALEKEVFVAVSAGVDMLVDASRSVIYWQQDYMQQVSLAHVPALIAVSFAGSYAGKRILAHVPQARFRNGVLVLIALIGLISLWKYLR